MCNSSIGSLEQALIQLQYALGDYYSCGKRAAEFSPLDASLRIPTKPATNSNRKPATDSDLKPAGIPI